jgi:hypothetical protein
MGQGDQWLSELIRSPALTPTTKRYDYRPEIQTLFRQNEFKALGSILIGPPFDDACVRKLAQSSRQQLGRHSGVPPDLLEPPNT